MPRYAIGDVQGCLAPLQQLLRKLRFKSDRDELIFAGDPVNRGPDSLGVLRLVRDLGDNARTVLGNHDLHLLAHHFDPARPMKRGDTLDEVLRAPDREDLLDWLLARPLLIRDAGASDVIVHAGLVPQWSIAEAAALAAQTERALRAKPREFLARMYGNQPDRWREDLPAEDRQRFTVNVLTRLRYCSADGTINLKLKESPERAPPPWLPWFAHAGRASAGVRVVFGHWSTLGLLREPNLLSLDTGCVWGGTLTAVNLDDGGAPPVQVPCQACQQPGAD